MIVLIDDKIYRKEKNLTVEIRSFPFFKDFVFDESGDIVEQINEHLKDAEVIILHRSYKIGNLSNDEIIKKINQLNPNVVIITFSGGSTTNSLGEKFFQVSAMDMYSNLFDFLAYYDRKGEIKPAILLYGKNYYKNELIALEYEIWKKLVEHEYDFNLSEDEDLLYDIEGIIEKTIKSKELDEHKDKLIDILFKISTVRELKQTVNEFVYEHE